VIPAWICVAIRDQAQRRQAADVIAFYDDLAEDYDALFEDWDASVRRQGTLLDGLLGSARGPVLDVAAGMGTQAIGLRLAGRTVVARDLSPALVARGRQAAARLSAPLEFSVADMRETRPEDAEKFDAVIAFDDALSHLPSDADLLAALRAAFRALTPGGRLWASIRDYDSLCATRPPLPPAQLLGAPPERRLLTQIWSWHDGRRSYDLEHFLARETPFGWALRVRRTRYRALLREELARAARSEGFVELRYLEPAESGFEQPIFCACRPLSG
jgi:glycine/sarcosine N-methyltransferase